jgi:hypothetical protein
MTYYNPLYTLIRGINELLSYLCYRPRDTSETPHPMPNSFASDFHCQTYTQQFPQSYDTPTNTLSRYTDTEVRYFITDLAYGTRNSEARIHSASPLTASEVEESRSGKQSHYHRHGHVRRERSYSLNRDLKAHEIQNNSRPQQRPSRRRQRPEGRQRRGHVESERRSIPSDIRPRKMPRERSGILSVNADDISNSSHDAVSGRRTKKPRVRFA